MVEGVPDVFWSQGEKMRLHALPLEDYFAMGGFKPAIDSNRIAGWRGYQGEWTLDGGRLYLVELTGHLVGGLPLTLAAAFPEAPGRVFAHWYSGVLCVARGKHLYRGYRYFGLYEEEWLLDMERGVLKSRRLRRNRIDMAGDRPQVVMGDPQPFPLAGEGGV